MALFETGLENGEMIIVSDPFPAISGMPIKSTTEKTLHQSIIDWVGTQQ
jgi:hypothetical protein